MREGCGLEEDAGMVETWSLMGGQHRDPWVILGRGMTCPIYFPT